MVTIRDTGHAEYTGVTKVLSGCPHAPVDSYNMIFVTRLWVARSNRILLYNNIISKRGQNYSAGFTYDYGGVSCIIIPKRGRNYSAGFTDDFGGQCSLIKTFVTAMCTLGFATVCNELHNTCPISAWLHTGKHDHVSVAILAQALPPRSPDLSPVEMFWGWVRRQLRLKDLNDLKQKRSAWGRLPTLSGSRRCSGARRHNMLQSSAPRSSAAAV